ncbi:MAG: hypothetical protein LC777_13995 [Actinobacteria bacterium]|nr:hypothetical protein [Actinomycetota bacterium]
MLHDIDRLFRCLKGERLGLGANACRADCDLRAQYPDGCQEHKQAKGQQTELDASRPSVVLYSVEKRRQRVSK